MIRAAATLAAGVLALTGCATLPDPEDPRAGPGWTQLPTPPLSPRTGAATAWTGSEALFLGGDTGPPCLDTGAGSGDCEVPPGARDGAAFDPVAGTWRQTAEAPAPIQGSLPTAVAGDTVFLFSAGQLLAYDASDDAWTVHPGPSGAPEYGRLAAVDGSVVLVAGERRQGEPSGHAFDPATGSWALLPEDPLGPAFDRVPTATTAGLVLTGHSLVPNPGSTEPSFVRAAVFDPGSSRWTLLDDSDQVGGWQWAWTGRRLVDPNLGTVDGGEVNGYGRDIPMGGVLDPATGTWAPLPNAPPGSSDGWWVEALGGPLTATYGWVYDDRAESWTLLPRPDGAPPQPGSAVWAGEALVVLGGVDAREGMSVDALSDSAWIWTPEAAGTDGPPGEADLAGVWALRAGTSGGEEISIPDQARATIEFTSGRVGGTSFCNRYGGSYRVYGADLTLEDVVGTDMACGAGALLEAEGAFHDVLRGGGLQVQVDGGGLVLTSDDGSLTFYRLPEVPTTALSGTPWVLESLVDGGTTSSAVGEPAVLQLRQGGSFTASTGCRSLRGHLGHERRLGRPRRLRVPHDRLLAPGRGTGPSSSWRCWAAGSRSRSTTTS